MSSEWKPDDIRLATVNGERMLVLRGRGIFAGNWYTQGPVAGSRLSVSDNWLLDDRPLVVLDPEDREQVERLNAAQNAEYARRGILIENYEGVDVDVFQAALREFANPTPPKPGEPTGLGAVVEDAAGERFVRHGLSDLDESVTWCDSTGVGRSWARISAVRVLSEGVQS